MKSVMMPASEHLGEESGTGLALQTPTAFGVSGARAPNWDGTERYKLYICVPSALRIDVEHSAVCLAEVCG